MYLNDFYYCYIKTFLSTFLIAFLKFLLILTRADLLYLMPADSAPHMPQISSDIIINKYHRHVGKHSMLASVSVIVSHLVSIREDDLRVLCQR